MNEIEKLKAEHARYKAALDEIHDEYSDVGGRSHYAYIVSDKALNPPPPPPVTLNELKQALARLSSPGNFYSVMFYDDESGSIRDKEEVRIFSFSSLRQAVDWLNQVPLT